MQGIWQSIEQFLMQSPWLVMLAILVVAFVESFAVIGVIVPGVLMLFALAFLANQLQLPLEFILLAAGAGALLGDGLSYGLGRFWQDRIWHLRWLQSHHKGLLQAHYFVNHSGALSIVVGRFVGPLRPLMPMVAGALGMRRRLFFALSGLSVVVWAPVYILPGWLAAQSMEFSMAILSNLAPWQLNLVLAVVALLVLTLWLIMDLWAYEKRNWHGGTRHMIAGTLSAFAAVALLWQKPWTLDLLMFNNRPQTGYWPDVWVHLSLLSQPELLFMMLAVAVLMLVMQGYKTLALTVSLASVISMAVALWLPEAIGIGRPSALHYALGSFSTPAAESLGWAFFITFISGLAPSHRRLDTLGKTVIAWVAVLLVIPSTALLGVHWFSDTLVGALIGVAIAHFALFVVRRWQLAHDIDWAPMSVMLLLVAYAHQLVFIQAYKYFYASLILTH